MKSILGFTLIELSLILGIGSFLAIAVSVPVRSLLMRSAVNSTSNSVLLAIQESRQNSISSKEGQSWGICFVSNKVFVFSGSCDSQGRRTSYSVQNLSSVSGLNTTTFSKLYGEPNPSNGLSNIVISGGNYSKTVSVNQRGGVSVIVY